MKIAIFGDMTNRKELQEAIQDVGNELGIEITNLDELPEQRIVVMCGHPLANVGIELVDCSAAIPYRENSFRGGSVGKGGKIKYRRG